MLTYRTVPVVTCQTSDESCMDVQDQKAIGDAAAREWICRTIRLTSGTRLQRLDRKERNAALAEMRRRGLSVRQIERLTGISRGTVQRMKP